ncbi:MAG: putative Quinone oxidoreductase [Chloroflexi bacterium]|jgi:putative PIG3 family NAD(P)H quinone oxidoreductase|nr:putative Quinone oxidoreductase [Chloroflexota bacterium]
MKAIVVREPGGPEVLEWRDAPEPQLQPNELLVRVRASAVNRADMLQRRGAYPPPPGASPILGLEMAGEVLEVGAACGAQWQPGQRVMALLAGGGYAEKVAVPAVHAIPIPENLSFEEAAAIPEAFLTAYLNLFGLGELKSGQTVLVHAGGSGVGTAAIQLAREAGAAVFVTAGSADKLERCRQLGATGLINYKQVNFAEKVKELTAGHGVDLILDFIGADYFKDNLASLALYGRLVLIGQMGGTKTELDLSLIMRRRLHITGTTLRARSLEEKAELTGQLAGFALQRFADGRLHPVIDTVFPISQAAEAHRYMESNQNFGKIVLKVD